MQLSNSLAQTLTNLNLPPYPTVTGLPQPITLRSLASFAAALGWTWLLLVSFTGWGKLTGRLFRVQRLPASVACCLGIATIVFLGGWLNLAHAIYPSVLFVLTAIGLLFYAALRGQRPEEYSWLRFWKRSSSASKILLVIALTILVLRVAATVRLSEFRIDDDGSGYLVFPQKMLEMHYFAADPFSDRRVISSLGGSYILQAFVIAATSLTHIGMADRTIGLILIFFALLDLGVAFGLSPSQIAMMELITYLVPQETFNLTFTILPIALFLAMIWIVFVAQDQEEHERWRSALLLGFVGGAILSLKSTFLPYIGAVALVPYLFLFWQKKRFHALSMPIVAGLGTMGTAAAWMVAMKHTSGTYLFPILGHGFDYSSYGVFQKLPRFSSSHAFEKTFLQGGLLLALAAAEYFAGIQDKRTRLSLSILLAAAFAITAFNFESGGDFIWRYNFPQFFTAILVFFLAQAAIHAAPDSVGRKMAAYILAFVCLLGCIFYYDIEGGGFKPFREMRTETSQFQRNLQASLSGRHLVSPDIASEYRLVEAAVPAGGTALDVGNDSFLLTDLDNKKVLLDDWPGAAGPPPGWPLMKGPEAVAAYLSRNSVRYVIFGYEYADWSSMKACQFFPHVAHFSELDEALETLSLVTLHQFEQLRAIHKTLYDNGQIVVIDLDSAASSDQSVHPNWTLATSKNEMCAVVVQRYLATRASKELRNVPSGKL
ncbi:MAG: hypothetical protein ACYCOR_15230 [Acidobacteriaceae bacterium]